VSLIGQGDWCEEEEEEEDDVDVATYGACFS
jgi:hypothetical protein